MLSRTHTTHHLDFFFHSDSSSKQICVSECRKKWKEEKCVYPVEGVFFFLFPFFRDSLTQRRLILEMLSSKKIHSSFSSKRICVSESRKKRRNEKTASPSRKGFFPI